MKFLVAAMLLVALSACKKDAAEPAPPPPSLTELLTSSRWICIGRGYYKNDTLFKNLYPETLPCVNDDEYVFNTDKSYFVTQGASSCGTAATSDTLFRGQWAFADEDKTLQVILETYTTDWEILTLTVDSLALRGRENPAGYREYFTRKP